MSVELTWIVVCFMIGLMVVIYATHIIAGQLRELHLSLNSRLDLLLDTTRRLALAEGFKSGQEDKREVV